MALDRPVDLAVCADAPLEKVRHGDLRIQARALEGLRVEASVGKAGAHADVAVEARGAFTALVLQLVGLHPVKVVFFKAL